MPRKSICLVVPERDSACAYYRSILPHRHCAPILAERGIDLVISDKESVVGSHDSYVFARTVGYLLFPMVSHLWMTEKRIFWDHDDNFRDIPKWNPAFEEFDAPFRSMLEQCNHMAGGFAVSTEPLADVMRETNPGKPITVLPNLVDCDDFSPPSLRNDGKVRILWAGSAYHSEDLKVILPALEAVKAEFGNKVEIIFAGYCPDFMKEALNPTMFAWWPITTHGRCLSLIGADIGLCPLSDAPEDLPFQRCKSAVKYFEYAMAGAFTVTSKDGPYKEAMAGLGSLCIGPDEWKSWLPQLVRDKPYMSSLLQRQHVRNCHSWQSDEKRSLWVEWYASLVA